MVVFLTIALLIVAALLLISIVQFMKCPMEDEKKKPGEKNAGCPCIGNDENPEDIDPDEFDWSDESAKRCVERDLKEIARYSDKDELGFRFVKWFGDCIRENLGRISRCEAQSIYKLWMLSAGGMDKIVGIEGILDALDTNIWTLYKDCAILRRTAENIAANIMDNLDLQYGDLTIEKLHALPLESRNAFVKPDKWEHFDPDYYMDSDLYGQKNPESSEQEVFVLVENKEYGNTKVVGPCLFLPEKPTGDCMIYGTKVDVDYIGPGFYYLYTEDEDGPKLFGIVTKRACRQKGYPDDDIDESERVIAWSHLRACLPAVFDEEGKK